MEGLGKFAQPPVGSPIAEGAEKLGESGWPLVSAIFWALRVGALAGSGPGEPDSAVQFTESCPA